MLTRTQGDEQVIERVTALDIGMGALRTGRGPNAQLDHDVR